MTAHHDAATRRHVRTAVSVLAAGLIAGGTGFAVGAHAGAVPTSAATAARWVSTATRALPMNGATRLGAAPAGQEMSISVVLSPRDPAGLRRAAEDVATPGAAGYASYLSPAQVAARYAPTVAETAAVASWLRAAGFSSVAVEPDRLFVDAVGDVTTVQRAFDTRIGLFRFAGRTVYANTSAALVPAGFGGLVLSVLGLSDIPMNLPLQLHTGAPAEPSTVTGAVARLAATSPPDTTGFTPQQLVQIYDAKSLPAATRTSIAVVVSGNMTSTIADLRHAERVDHAPAAPVSVVYTSPERSIVDGNPYTGNLEWDLDTQMSTMMASDVAHEYLYDVATLDDADVARAINQFVEQDRAVAGSASLGECDAQPWLDGAMVATDAVLEEGALQGQSFFASSGDNGFACPEIASTGVPGGVPGASWPADATWATGVGGTTLLATSAGAYEEEISWIGGGGGVSEFETPGNWTATADAAARGAEYLPSGGRGVPDVAADADPNLSPVVVWQGNSSTLVGGTSVSSPLVLGLWARMQTAHANRLGLAAIDFYRLYDRSNKTGSAPASPAGFHDVVVGSNGLYTALPGYDFTTGIGSLEAAVLSHAL